MSCLVTHANDLDHSSVIGLIHRPLRVASRPDDQRQSSRLHPEGHVRYLRGPSSLFEYSSTGEDLEDFEAPSAAFLLDKSEVIVHVFRGLKFLL